MYGFESHEAEENRIIRSSVISNFKVVNRLQVDETGGACATHQKRQFCTENFRQKF
jgi:hypothetical protein